MAGLLYKTTPLFVGWAVTNKCNSKCVYCDRRNLKVPELATGDIVSSIRSLSKIGLCGLNFTGGEPLLREDLREIMEYSIRTGIRVSVASNGILVPQKLGLLKGVSHLGLSLDGHEDEHDFLRGRGSYKTVLKAAEVSTRQGIKVIFYATITKTNLKSLNHILGIGRRFNSKVIFSIVSSIPYASDKAKELAPDAGEFSLYFDKLSKLKREGNKNIGNSLSGIRYILDSFLSLNKHPCKAGYMYYRIEADGNIYRCSCVADKEEPLMNCKDLIYSKGLKSDNAGVPCRGCWCGNKAELNCVLSLKLDSIINALRIN